MMNSNRDALREGKTRRIRFLILLGFSALLVTNSLLINSSVVGTIMSLGLISLISLAIGEVFYADENLFFKCLFGFATLLLLLALSGTGLTLIEKFTEILSLIVLVVMSILFGVASLRQKSVQSQNHDEDSSVSQGSKRKDLHSYIMILIFLSYVAVAFRFLILARTDAGGSSVWLEISPFFIPFFAFVTLFLCVILFFVRISDSLKLVLLSVFMFLAHSLFLFVWYPSRYGDPLRILGMARYTARTGTIYAYDWLISHFLVVGIISYRAQFALTIFFERMFSIDIYWVHMILVPLLWSVFLPCLAYEIAKLLTTKRNKAFPLLTALSTGLFPSLILWGTVSVPNSLGFVFFFLFVVLLLKWMNGYGKSYWFMSFLALVVTFLTHLQPGLFALGLFLWGNSVQVFSRRSLKILSWSLIFALYPVGLYFYGALFSASGLLALDNFFSFQLEVTNILLVFGLLGLVLGLRGKLINAKSTLIIFGFYVLILFEYYLTNFGMTNVPYGPARVLVMGDLLLVPFVALGILETADIFRKAVTTGKRAISLTFFSKIGFHFNPHLTALALICLFISLEATSVLYQAYPREEAVDYQPSAYMIEAVQYINSTAPGRYVVLGDTMISTVAIGFLGIDYGWAGGDWGFFGMPDPEYPTVKMYRNMTKRPSINIMLDAMNFGNASISYFVVWEGHPNFEWIVQQTLKILPEDRDFGDGKLYVFNYPAPTLKEELGPEVKVTFDDGLTEYRETELVYFFETEINSTLTLSGHTSYNITQYPVHWTFLDLRVNNVSRKLDEDSDINEFVYVKELKPEDVLTVKWRWNRNYSRAVWKEDSFKKGWRTHDVYTGTITSTIITDGNILNMSYSFTPGPYLYYYYIKAVNIVAGANQSIIVRWKSDSPIAVVVYYFELGLTSGVNVVPLGSKSVDWKLTIVPLDENMNITYVMVGISNLWARDLSEAGTLSVDYIMIATSSMERG